MIVNHIFEMLLDCVRFELQKFFFNIYEVEMSLRVDLDQRCKTTAEILEANQNQHYKTTAEILEANQK